MDSLMALMRNEYLGIGMLAKRQGVLNNMIHALSRIAETYNCAILLTNQVTTKMMGMFSAEDAIGGNIVAHGCHFRVMFKTKGFSSNNSLKRRAIIVDAPDLPPEECEFYITSTGIADTENSEITITEEPILDFEVEKLYEESDHDDVEEPIGVNDNSTSIPITNVKGVGKGTAENLRNKGITSINDLISADPEELASKISGISSKKVVEMQKSAEILLKS